MSGGGKSLSGSSDASDTAGTTSSRSKSPLRTSLSTTPAVPSESSAAAAVATVPNFGASLASWRFRRSSCPMPTPCRAMMMGRHNRHKSHVVLSLIPKNDRPPRICTLSSGIPSLQGASGSGGNSGAFFSFFCLPPRSRSGWLPGCPHPSDQERGPNPTSIDQAQHNGITDDRSEFLHQVQGKRGPAVESGFTTDFTESSPVRPTLTPQRHAFPSMRGPLQKKGHRWCPRIIQWPVRAGEATTLTRPSATLSRSVWGEVMKSRPCPHEIAIASRAISVAQVILALFTPKALNIKAQGRVAHPGNASIPGLILILRTPAGFHTALRPHRIPSRRGQRPATPCGTPLGFVGRAVLGTQGAP